jgi:hypothetical protein
MRRKSSPELHVYDLAATRRLWRYENFAPKAEVVGVFAIPHDVLASTLALCAHGSIRE